MHTAQYTKQDIEDYAPFTIELTDGRTARIEVIPDEHMGEPWKEHDGHGIVSEWTTRAKLPGELILASDRNSRRYYDFAESVKIARRDGWGADGKTPGERAAKATAEDYRRLRDWCEDRWCWVGVAVTVTKANGEFDSDSLWGIESDGDYWRDAAAELLNGLL